MRLLQGEPVTCVHMDESPRHFRKQNKPITKEQVCFHSSEISKVDTDIINQSIDHQAQAVLNPNSAPNIRCVYELMQTLPDNKKRGNFPQLMSLVML